MLKIHGLVGVFNQVESFRFSHNHNSKTISQNVKPQNEKKEKFFCSDRIATRAARRKSLIVNDLRGGGGGRVVSP